MKKIVIMGSGGHARMVQDFIEDSGDYEIVGFTTNKTELEDLYGYPVLGDDSVLPDLYKRGIRHAAIGIGGFTENRLRKKIFELAKTYKFEVITLIHDSAVISKYAKIGEGTIIMPNVVINNDVVIGENCVIANGAIISHESIIGNHVLISAGVVVGGNVIIGEGSLLALGAKVISGIKIGSNCLVAAGAVVVNNLGPDLKVFGIPAKPKL